MFYCKPADDYLPQPGAVLIPTGITPREAREKTKPLSPDAFMRCLPFPKTCVVGYNNVRFDDEVAQYFFIAAFTRPTLGWQHDEFTLGSPVDVMRLLCLRPEGNWPAENDDGLPAFVWNI